MNAPEEKDPFAQYLARMAGDLTPVVDGGAMAGSAIRREKRRRVVLTVAACLAVLVAMSGAMGAVGTVYANRQEPMPATSDSVQAEPSPSVPPSDDDGPAEHEPVRYVRTGGGELPVMPGVVHGVTDDGAAPYILGGLWYEVPAGGWTSVGDVAAGGRIGWASPDSELANERLGETLDLTVDDVVTDIELRNVPDASGWSAPDRDSGAMTLEIEGADLVVIEPFKVVTEERNGAETEVRPVKTRIRSGGEGWIIETRFPADDAGDAMLRDFLGNLWLNDYGEPDWYEPMFEYHELGPVEHAVPAGWTRATTGGLSYAYPERWRAAPRDDGMFGELVEVVSDETVTVAPEADPVARWSGYVESGDPGANFWPGVVDLSREGTSEIEVPGADYAVVQVIEESAAPGEEGPGSLFVEIHLHQEGNGNHAKVTLDFPGGDEGIELVRQFLGTLSYEN
ncbi:hypothetical protein [Myceligenerans pegani]|uniref:Uncharacterized protein n=1 Tax=Myceligenerans pegani TaxID=2776917 RepID=A0ABR9MVJ3_9MICO|nr:hypothetical protein [Myceligenerans sp. TRM 65318]MBE1874777.1 hypothetical protein [Myceligenerans sp. TRM 65318]MBE3017048.1 hypothetical protein [Myceligenerans sp. TRM 65318]